MATMGQHRTNLQTLHYADYLVKDFSFHLGGRVGNDSASPDTGFYGNLKVVNSKVTVPE